PISGMLGFTSFYPTYINFSKEITDEYLETKESEIDRLRNQILAYQGKIAQLKSNLDFLNVTKTQEIHSLEKIIIDMKNEKKSLLEYGFGQCMMCGKPEIPGTGMCRDCSR
ncbi:MAG: hypothetical protein ACOC04_02680, partial [Halothece sp.]